MQPGNTSHLIEEFIASQDALDARQQYMLGQLLHSLVRQARSEQLTEMRRNLARLCGEGVLEFRTEGSGAEAGPTAG